MQLAATNSLKAKAAFNRQGLCPAEVGVEVAARGLCLLAEGGPLLLLFFRQCIVGARNHRAVFVL